MSAPKPWEIPNVNPHKLFPDNPCPYSKIWEMENTIGIKYTIDWETQTLSYRDERAPEILIASKITWARMQKNPLSPGLYLKLDDSTVKDPSLEHVVSWKVDGKNYIPFWKIEPTPGRELPPLDNPDAEWTGTVTNGVVDYTNEEIDALIHQMEKEGRERFFARRKRQFEVMELLSTEQKEAVCSKKENHKDILQMTMDYVNGKIDRIDNNVGILPDYKYDASRCKTEESPEHDFDVTDD